MGCEAAGVKMGSREGEAVDMRVGREIQKDSVIESPRVSHLARLSLLARKGVIVSR